jgi:hypothetical protein
MITQDDYDELQRAFDELWLENEQLRNSFAGSDVSVEIVGGLMPHGAYIQGSEEYIINLTDTRRRYRYTFKARQVQIEAY